MEADDLLCSRNARPQMDTKEQADRSSCSQSPHDKKDWKDQLDGGGRSMRAVKNNLLTPSGKVEESEGPRSG